MRFRAKQCATTSSFRQARSFSRKAPAGQLCRAFAENMQGIKPNALAHMGKPGFDLPHVAAYRRPRKINRRLPRHSEFSAPTQRFLTNPTGATLDASHRNRGTGIWKGRVFPDARTKRDFPRPRRASRSGSSIRTPAAFGRFREQRSRARREPLPARKDRRYRNPHQDRPRIRPSASPMTNASCFPRQRPLSHLPALLSPRFLHDETGANPPLTALCLFRNQTMNQNPHASS